MLDAPSAADASARPQLPPDPATASVSVRPAPSASDALFAAARTLLPVLEAGRPLDAGTLRDAMTRAFGATDAEGAWLWKDAYEAAEAAVVLFVQRYGRAMRKQTGAGPDGPRHMLAMLDAVAALEPSHTKRSEEQIRLQQFSTPLPLAYAALRAAAIRPGDTVLEPSAGTGMLAVIAECAMGNRAAGSLYLNEYAHTRAHLLTHLFPQAVTTAFNAEAIADRLHDVTPTAVIMNPPFSATPGVDRIRHDADLRHIRSAFSMLPPGGRLVTITSANCIPGDAAWRDTFDSVDGGACTVFTMAIDGRAYARRGTGFDTRLTVLERSAKPEIDIDREARAADAAELLDTVIAKVPPRLPITPETARPIPAGPARDLFGKPVRPPATKGSTGANSAATPATAHDWGPVAELVVETGAPDTVTHESATQANAGPYEPWRPGVARVPGAIAHPTPLVQSAAMAAVPHPVPTYRPVLPERVVRTGSCRTRNSKASCLRARPTPAISPRTTASVRAGRPCSAARRTTATMATLPAPPMSPTTARSCPPRCASGAAGCSATAPAPARAARSPPSCSTTGCAAAGARSGCRSPTSWSRTQGATGARSAGARTT